MPRSTRLPVMLAVKTRPRARKLTASVLPAAAVSARRSASRSRGCNSQPVSGGPQPRGAAFEQRSLVGGHRRLEDADHTASADHARQRQGDAVALLIAGDREDRALVAQDRFRQPGADDPDAVLAGIVALDDGDVRVSDVALNGIPNGFE